MYPKRWEIISFVKTSAPEPLPIKKIKEEPKPQRVVETKRPVAKQTYREEYKKIEPTIQLESYYYGILPKESNNDSGVPVSFNVKVTIFSLSSKSEWWNGDKLLRL